LQTISQKKYEQPENKNGELEMKTCKPSTQTHATTMNFRVPSKLFAFAEKMWT
jgi:hypothetical protein